MLAILHGGECAWRADLGKNEELKHIFHLVAQSNRQNFFPKEQIQELMDNARMKKKTAFENKEQEFIVAPFESTHEDGESFLIVEESTSESSTFK